MVMFIYILSVAMTGFHYKNIGLFVILYLLLWWFCEYYIHKHEYLSHQKKFKWNLVEPKFASRYRIFNKYFPYYYCTFVMEGSI